MTASKVCAILEDSKTHNIQGIQVISRAASILRLLAENTQGMSLGQIAKGTQLPRSTIQRIVSALTLEGLTASDGGYGRIKLGPTIPALAQAVPLDMTARLRPIMQSIAQATGETVDLSILDGDHMQFLDQIVGSQRLRTVTSIGDRFPLTTTANGKAALALMDQDNAAKLILAEFKQGVEARSLAGTLSELDSIRAGALASDENEHTDGICALGFAVTDVNGEIYAVSTPVPATRFEQVREQLAKALEKGLSEFRM